MTTIVEFLLQISLAYSSKVYLVFRLNVRVYARVRACVRACVCVCYALHSSMKRVGYEMN